MNDKTRAGLSVIMVATLGIVMTIWGMVEHWEAMDCGNAFQYTDGAIRMIFGCLFILISLVMKIWIEGFMKIKELQDDIQVLQGRIDHLEDKTYKESYSHDIEDEVF